MTKNIEELKMLQEEANRYTIGISKKRIRKPANRDQAYNEAAITQQLDSGTRGGLVSGSGYHYDRSYRW
jgi:hypothetical protein